VALAAAVLQRWWATAGNLVDDLTMRRLIELPGFPASCADTFTGV
jgi:hypothetical protein